MLEQYLLPNEDVRIVCRTRSGHLVLTNRRVALVHIRRQLGHLIERSVLIEHILDIEQTKTDRFRIYARVVDHYGKDIGTIESFEVRAPKGADFSDFFSAMNRFPDIVEELSSSGPQQLDLSYLEKLPKRLTKDAVLDLNTILRDQPQHNELVPEARKFLGDKPFILEDCLRDGTDRENGFLFAAGKNGYYWIQGKKQGRFMTNVIVDTVEWDNFLCFVHQWNSTNANIFATYSLIKGGRQTIREYLWAPPTSDDVIEYPWLLQERNGPLILTDVWRKYSK